jgi:predicted KAP-like P-loop ATPase
VWNDNETDVDLVGFDHLAETITTVVRRGRLLPLTIGVYGDWGSGKSSVMCMARNRLAQTGRHVCVAFSPWQYEDYDDVKAALMTAVMTALQQRLSLLERTEKVAGQQATQARQKLRRLMKRVRWLRVASLTAKGASSIALLAHGEPAGLLTAASGLPDLSQLVQPEQIERVAEKIEASGKELLDDRDAAGDEREDMQDRDPVMQSVGRFREDLTDLLGRLDVDALVVFIDDLDRCLPDTIVDTLEALRLFLAVPKSAFVIGADEGVIRHAIETRYPGLGPRSRDVGRDYRDIGRDYLEKIIQLPLRIPPLDPAETETYLNLLGCELYTPKLVYDALVKQAEGNRRIGILAVAMNYGIAAPIVTGAATMSADQRVELEQHMQLIQRIALTLCGGLQGNPRQTKRFMNTLLLRQDMAATRGITLDAAVLAKLMILEYFHEMAFHALFQWQSDGQGTAAPLELLEHAAASGREPVPEDLSREAATWLSDPALLDWLRLDPPLLSQNLAPYFYFSRDQRLMTSGPARRLSQVQQELLGKLLAKSDTERNAARRDATTLPIETARPVYEEVLAVA